MSPAGPASPSPRWQRAASWPASPSSPPGLTCSPRSTRCAPASVTSKSWSTIAPSATDVPPRAYLREAISAGAPHLLLDNLTPAEAAEWIAEIAGRAKVELSGGITLENVRAYAEAGADFVSSGAITHSARAVDISFRLELA